MSFTIKVLLERGLTLRSAIFSSIVVNLVVILIVAESDCHGMRPGLCVETYVTYMQVQ